VEQEGYSFYCFVFSMIVIHLGINDPENVWFWEEIKQTDTYMNIQLVRGIDQFLWNKTLYDCEQLSTFTSTSINDC